MISLLGKAGLLEEAESYLKGMSSEPSGLVWMTMLNACKLHGDIKRAEEAVKRVIDMDEYNEEACRILASMYDAAGIEVDEEPLKDEFEDQMGNVT
jgi:two-component SAPR family response regulator